MLYTGDEMGFMIKWDVSKVIEKLEMQRPRDAMDELGAASTDGETKKMIKKSTYIT